MGGPAEVKRTSLGIGMGFGYGTEGAVLLMDINLSRDLNSLFSVGGSAGLMSKDTANEFTLAPLLAMNFRHNFRLESRAGLAYQSPDGGSDDGYFAYGPSGAYMIAMPAIMDGATYVEQSEERSFLGLFLGSRFLFRYKGMFIGPEFSGTAWEQSGKLVIGVLDDL